ncbi:SLC13 family permease [Natronospora cellulosivora (SeqCode)]
MFKYCKRLIVIIGIILSLLILFLPLPNGLTIEGKRALAVFILCISLWISHVIPLSITALLGMALIPILGIQSSADTFALFGNQAIFFILGALIIAAALFKTGLGSRISFKLIILFGKSPKRMLMGVFVSSALMACLMPEHAVAALMFPIVHEIAEALDLKPLKSVYGKFLFISMAWGTIIGGLTTYLGGARALLAAGLLETNFGISIGFLEWIKYSWPIPFFMVIIYCFMILKVFKLDLKTMNGAYEKFKNNVDIKKKLSKEERKLSFILILVLFAWLFLSNVIHISVTAILGGSFIFILRIVKWEQIEDYVNWEIILMYGGAIALATTLAETSVINWISKTFFSNIGISSFVFLILLALFTILLTESVSNVAAVAIVLPLAYSFAGLYDINPVIVTLTVALNGGLAFMLPMGSPPNAIAFSSGYYKIQDAILWGIVMNVIGWGVYILVLRYYWPLIGL